MTRTHKLVCLLNLVISYSLQAQHSTRVTLATATSSTYLIDTYSPVKKIYPRFKSISEVKNSSIDELITSVLCATNQDWVDFNTLGGNANSTKKTEADFNVINRRDNTKTYVELRALLTINASAQTFYIVKFRLFLEQAPEGVPGAYLIQQVNGRYYVTSRSDLSNLVLMNMFIKTDRIKAIFNRNTVLADKRMAELLRLIYQNNELNVSKLYNEFEKWQTDLAQSNYFLDPSW